MDFVNFVKYIQTIHIHLNRLMYFTNLKSENDNFEKDD